MSTVALIKTLCEEFYVDFSDVEALAELGNYKAQIILGIVRAEQGDLGKAISLCRKGLAAAAQKYDKKTLEVSMGLIKVVSEEGVSSLQELYYYLMLDLASVVGISPYEGIAEWAEPLAQRGSTPCQRIIGELYAYGKGVRRDYQKALEYLRMAAGDGDSIAQYELGRIFLEGEGVKADNDKAFLYLSLSASNGNADAEALIGLLLFKHERYEEAAKFLLRAAKKGIAEAQNALGLMFEVGLGVEENMVEAVRWLRKAAENGHDDAKKELAKLGR